MAARIKKAVYGIIYFLPAVGVLFFIGFGVYYQRMFVKAAEFKPTVVGTDNITAKLYGLDNGKYLLVLSEVAGRRVEGYYINLTQRKMGYANFSVSTYTPLVGSWAMMSRDVLEEFETTEELSADFSIISGIDTVSKEAPASPKGDAEASGQNTLQSVMITLKGPSEMATNLDPSAEQIYKKHLICKKTILLER